MAGTIPLSLTQQFDEFGKPLSGGLLYIYQAGTVATPQQPYQDYAKTVLQPNPIVLDAAGRVPQFFLDDGFVKFRLVSKTGIQQVVRDNVLVIGPSSGSSGSSGGIDPTTQIQTGMLALFYGKGVVEGFVRANGLSIGSSTSGATEKADTQKCLALFTFLWNNDSRLIVRASNGAPVTRGSDAATDFGANNRQIDLPDWRGRNLTCLDDNGSTAKGLLTSTYFAGKDPSGNAVAATVLGAAGGFESNTLAATHIPSTGLSVSGTTSNDSPDHTHPYTAPSDSGARVSGTGNLLLPTYGASNTGGASARHTHTFSANLAGGGGQAHANVQPSMLCSVYLKL